LNNTQTKKIKIGNITIGGGSKIAIQSMLNAPAENIEENVRQAVMLEKAGCEIVRVAVPNIESVVLVEKIKDKIKIPLVADIHFDYKLAIECANAGVDKIRINPGNIGDEDRIKAVADICKLKGIPIRIGVNSGSVEKHILAKYQKPTPEALVESALYHSALLEKFDFNDIVISIKSSNVKTMIDAYRLISEKCCYPLHLGVTEAGTERMGLIKSSIGIGSLLADNIGDTIRVSLTASPEKEIYAAKDILKSLGMLENGAVIVSCPTCGRTKINLIKLAEQVEEALKACDKPITVAVMGCAVNGPGEAKEADIGIAGGDGCALLFKKGEIIKKVDEKDVLNVLLEEIDLL